MAVSGPVVASRTSRTSSTGPCFSTTRLTLPQLVHSGRPWCAGGPGRVDQRGVHAVLLGLPDRVEGHRRRVRAFRAAHGGRADALSPQVCSWSAAAARNVSGGAEHDGAAVGDQDSGELAGGGGLADLRSRRRPSRPPGPRRRGAANGPCGRRPYRSARAVPSRSRFAQLVGGCASRGPGTRRAQAARPALASARRRCPLVSSRSSISSQVASSSLSRESRDSRPLADGRCSSGASRLRRRTRRPAEGSGTSSGERWSRGGSGGDGRGDGRRVGRGRGDGGCVRGVTGVGVGVRGAAFLVAGGMARLGGGRAGLRRDGRVAHEDRWRAPRSPPRRIRRQ